MMKANAVARSAVMPMAIQTLVSTGMVMPCGTEAMNETTATVIIWMKASP